MADPDLVDRANEVLDSARLLDDALLNAHAFRLLLGSLQGRLQFDEDRRHTEAVAMVRAALVRAQLSAVIAMLDPWDRRGNRASIGHVVEVLNDTDVRAVLCEGSRFQRSTPVPEKLAEMRQKYQEVVGREEFKRARHLRNDAVAHLLRPDTPTPSVLHEENSWLQEKAELLVSLLFEGLGIGSPANREQRQTIFDRASQFWDTYYEGVRRTK